MCGPGRLRTGACCRRRTWTALTPRQRIGQWERIVSAADGSDGETLVADAGGRLSGFVSYGPARDDGAESRRAGEIYAIYLVPAAWDEGIGRQLMAAALGRLGEAGFDQVILWVLDSNARARRFMRRAAGSLTGLRSGMTVSAFR